MFTNYSLQIIPFCKFYSRLLKTKKSLEKKYPKKTHRIVHSNVTYQEKMTLIN